MNLIHIPTKYTFSHTVTLAENILYHLWCFMKLDLNCGSTNLKIKSMLGMLTSFYYNENIYCLQNRWNTISIILLKYTFYNCIFYLIKPSCQICLLLYILYYLHQVLVQVPKQMEQFLCMCLLKYLFHLITFFQILILWYWVTQTLITFNTLCLHPSLVASLVLRSGSGYSTYISCLLHPPLLIQKWTACRLSWACT